MKLDVDSPVVYLGAALVFAVGASLAWWWGCRRSKGQVVALWVAALLTLLLRFGGLLVHELKILQPVLILMIAAAMGGTLGRHPSRWRIVLVALVFWGALVALSNVLFIPRYPEILWAGPPALLRFILDPGWFLDLFE